MPKLKLYVVRTVAAVESEPAMGWGPGRRAEREPVEATVGCAKPWERGMSVGDSAGLLAGRTGVVISVGLRPALESMPVGAVIRG